MQEAVIDTTTYLASITERAKILAGPDYFTCERTHARIRKIDCINRQTEGVRLEGSLKKEIPPECKECPQGKGILAGENGRKGESETRLRSSSFGAAQREGVNMRKGENQKEIVANNERAFETVKAECQDKKCEFWLPDGCTYQGRLVKGLCKRKYMQQCWKDKKAQGRKGEREKGSKKETEKKEGALPLDVQAELEQPAEEHVDAPSILLDFAGMEDLYEDLEEAAKEQVRTPKLQALWYIKRSLLERKVVP